MNTTQRRPHHSSRGSHALIHKGQRLVYEVDGHDAADPVLFTLTEAGDGLTVNTASAGDTMKLTFSGAALERSKTFLRIVQGTPYVFDDEVQGGEVDRATPPFLLSRETYRALKAGSASLRLAGDVDVALQLEGESTILAHVAGKPTTLPVLRATGEDARLIVLDDPTWPLVFQWRHHGESVSICGVGPKLELGDDGELPELPRFSTYAPAADQARPAASGTNSALTVLLGRACDAFKVTTTTRDPGPAIALVQEAARSDPAAQPLASLIQPGKYGPPYSDAPKFLRACLLAPRDTGLPAAAEALIAERKLATWLPLRPSGVRELPHDRIWSVTFGEGRCWTIGDSRTKTVVAEWNLADGRLERVVDAGKRGGAIVSVTANGTVLRIEGSKLLAAPPGKTKVAPRNKLDAPTKLGVTSVDPSGRLLAEQVSHCDDDGNRRAQLVLTSLESGASLGTIEFPSEIAFACLGHERVLVATTEALEVYTVGALSPLKRRVWTEERPATPSLSADGRHALIRLGDTKTRLINLETFASEGEFNGDVTFAGDALIRTSGHQYEVLGLDGKVRATFVSGGDQVFFGPGAVAVSYRDRDDEPALDLWRPVHIDG